MGDEDDASLSRKKSEAPPPRRRPKKIVIPRRAPSVVVPVKEPYYPSPDKTTCAECTCFPKEDPYRKPKKLNPCQHSPLTLYELAVAVVDSIHLPPAFQWSVEDVATWCEKQGLPQYKACMLDNHIDGMRLLMLEDPSKPPQINIHDFKHIQLLTSKIRQEYGMDFIRFARSVGLPPRRPLVHCTWFKSRTGPSWGVRKNWTRGDILRWMKIIMPAPVYRDHWDLVWYQKPEFPSVKFARFERWAKWKPFPEDHIPHYKETREVCREYQVPRKFRIQRDIPEEYQLIWMEHRPGSQVLLEEKERERKKKEKKKKDKKKTKFVISKDSRLFPKKVKTEGLAGDELLLARRKKNKPKFLAKINC